MYGIIRIIISIIVCIFLLKLCKPKKKRIYFLITISSVCFCTILMALPVENLFIEFKSPQQVMNYAYPTEKNIVDVAYGKNSCMVISEKAKSSYSIKYLKTDNNSFKIPFIFDYTTESQYSDGYANFSITHLNNSSDYYLFGTYISSEDIKAIKDASNSDIKFICNAEHYSEQTSKAYKTYFIYGAINSYTKNYSLQINNQNYNF